METARAKDDLRRALLTCKCRACAHRSVPHRLRKENVRESLSRRSGIRVVVRRHDVDEAIEVRVPSFVPVAGKRVVALGDWKLEIGALIGWLCTHRIVTDRAGLADRVARRIRGNHGRIGVARGINHGLEERHPRVFPGPVAALSSIDDCVDGNLSAKIAIDKRLFVAFEVFERERSAGISSSEVFEHRELHRVRDRVVVSLANERAIGPRCCGHHVSPAERTPR